MLVFLTGATGYIGSAVAQALRRAGFEVSSYAVAMMRRPELVLAREKARVELVTASMRELGLEHESTLQTIYAKAKERGWSSCPPEVGPQLRLQYVDQPEGEPGDGLRIAMKAIPSEHGARSVFVVSNTKPGYFNAGPRLGNAEGAKNATTKALDVRWVFVAP